MKVVDCSIQQSDSEANAKARVRLVIADSPDDPTSQPEHTIIQVEIDVPPNQALGVLQARALEQAYQTLGDLVRGLRNAAH